MADTGLDSSSASSSQDGADEDGLPWSWTGLEDLDESERIAVIAGSAREWFAGLMDGTYDEIPIGVVPSGTMAARIMRSAVGINDGVSVVRYVSPFPSLFPASPLYNGGGTCLVNSRVSWWR